MTALPIPPRWFTTAVHEWMEAHPPALLRHRMADLYHRIAQAQPSQLRVVPATVSEIRPEGNATNPSDALPRAYVNEAIEHAKKVAKEKGADMGLLCLMLILAECPPPSPEEIASIVRRFIPVGDVPTVIPSENP